MKEARCEVSRHAAEILTTTNILEEMKNSAREREKDVQNVVAEGREKDEQIAKLRIQGATMRGQVAELGEEVRLRDEKIAGLEKVDAEKRQRNAEMMESTARN
ncbi:hypothetical protein PMIN06_008485 [Paraphaeosphaeria minitans]|uniref:Uncharacterized protein n=1 Tax=Paraphaeosphaeria minitans TaxID=565426 RepID=A0A9P6GLT5_9PLEO|nr:hypothetical protein PMIN01_03295 [Paraphaeosphaeria minitans]